MAGTMGRGNGKQRWDCRVPLVQVAQCGVETGMEMVWVGKGGNNAQA